MANLGLGCEHVGEAKDQGEEQDRETNGADLALANEGKSDLTVAHRHLVAAGEERVDALEHEHHGERHDDAREPAVSDE